MDKKNTFSTFTNNWQEHVSVDRLNQNEICGLILSVILILNIFLDLTQQILLLCCHHKKELQGDKDSVVMFYFLRARQNNRKITMHGSRGHTCKDRKVNLLRQWFSNKIFVKKFAYCKSKLELRKKWKLTIVMKLWSK